MKAFIKFSLLIIALVCVLIGFDKISHTYEIAEEKYDTYIHELLKEDDDGIIDIPTMVEEYHVSANIKEIISLNVCIMVFGMLLLLILIVDFIRWVNTWEKEED